MVLLLHFLNNLDNGLTSLFKAQHLKKSKLPKVREPLYLLTLKLYSQKILLNSNVKQPKYIMMD